jgi:hypothetical protein
MSTKDAVKQLQEYVNVPLAELVESSTNPRKTFDEERLEEFADFVPGNKIRVMFRIRLCGLRENTVGQIYAIDLTNPSLESIRLATSRSEP